MVGSTSAPKHTDTARPQLEPDHVVVFRVDASIRLGLGHLMRCLTLATTLRECGLRSLFICRYQAGEGSQLIRKYGFDCHLLSEFPAADTDKGKAYQLALGWQQDIQETLTALASRLPHAFVIDHYGIDEYWEAELARAYPGTPILVIDDLANRPHVCSALLDQTLGRAARDYNGKVPIQAALWLGTPYAILRQEFTVLPQPIRRMPSLNEAWHILVSMGGTDPDNQTLAILKCLEVLPVRQPRTEISVIMGRHAPHLKEVAGWCQQHTQRLIVDTDHMVDFLDWAHLAIGAGGTSASERCARSLPSLLLIMAENQRQVTQSLTEEGACINLGECYPFPSAKLHSALQTMLQNADAYQKMVDCCRQLFDGHGATRAAKGLCELIASSPIRLLPMSLADNQRLWQWQCEPNNRQFFRNPAPPDWMTHNAWFKHAMASADIHLYRIDWQTKAVGMIRLDMQPEKNHAEVSILLSQVAQGKGLGRQALHLICTHYPCMHLYAEIHPENFASQRVFIHCGFTKLDKSHYQRRGNSE